MDGAPDFSDDRPVLAALGAPEAELIGHGGEARVYALDGGRVVRVLHPGASVEGAEARTAFLAEIAAGARHLPWATPRVEEIVAAEGRVAMLEARLPGAPVSQLLRIAEGAEREALLAAYLGVAEQVAGIAVSRDFFGDLLADPAVRRTSHRAYLGERIAETRRHAGDMAALLTGRLAADMPDCAQAGFVHFDLFPGNVLMADGTVSAVIDFGATAMIADPRLEAWSMAAYLDPQISPDARDADRAVARDWLAGRGLLADYAAARRWIAGYWCFATDDPKVMAWCRSVLDGGDQERPSRSPSSSGR